VLNLRKRIPTIMDADEILDKAFRRAVKIDAEGDSKFHMIQRKSAARIMATADIISNTLIKYNRAFPSLNDRNEFVAELINVLIGVDELKKALSKVEWAAQKVSELQREYTGKVQRATDLNSMDNERKQYYGRISSVLQRIDKDLKFLQMAREELRKVPDFDSSMPAVVIAGFPNVGKSQLVEKISTAKPQIAAYPFTTQGIGVGHFEKGWRKFQIIDTPGLLDRPLEDRNEIELQAVLALKHLADVIVFVLDPSETSGYSYEKQLHLLESIRTSFEGIPFIEVENKVDLIRTDSDRIKISAMAGENLDALRDEIVRVLKSTEAAALPMEPLE
jgi:nucleolar GTP-binding protein